MTTATARILVVEDNTDLAAGIEHNLRLEGYDVALAETGPQALEVAGRWPPDLVLLDLMIPGIDGFRVLQRLRADGCRAPVIILTARAEEADKVRGFRLDADQYVTKPFGVLELLERIAALLRRSARESAPRKDVLHFGDVTVDLASRQVTKRGAPCALTPKAYELLLALVRRHGAVASRHELLKEVWGYDADVMTRTVDSHVAELRRKLEDDPASPTHILTVWTVGYRFSEGVDRDRTS